MTISMIGILNSFVKDYKNFADACDHLNVPYKIVDVLSADWLNNIRQSGCNAFFVRPSDDLAERNAVYMERLYFINKVLGHPIYPSWEELFIYENKRTSMEWLKIHGFPHPETKIFIQKKEALAFLDGADYPLVFKSRTSAGARGVTIVKNRWHASYLAHRHFGLFEPRLAIGYFKPKIKWGIPILMPGMFVRHYLIAQKFEPIKWEWRLIKIGDTYAGHQKLLKGDFASGSGLVGWDTPPATLLSLFRTICEKGRFNCMAADIFETIDGRFLVNELQTMFGSYAHHQLRVNNIPGRFLLRDGVFVFEEGEYHQFGSALLKVQDFLRILKQGS